MADLAGMEAPAPGVVLIVTCDADGALGHMRLGRGEFADLGKVPSASAARAAAKQGGRPWTGKSILAIIDEAKDRLRENKPRA